MNDFELLEMELRRLKPAQPPAEFSAHLAQTLRRIGPQTRPRSWDRIRSAFGARTWRWMAPATAIAVVLILIGVLKLSISAPNQSPKAASLNASRPAIKADHVEINRQLVATFDTVAQLPTGEPIRFQCSEWREDVVLRDSAHRLLIKQEQPRLEIVPVTFEIY